MARKLILISVFVLLSGEAFAVSLNTDALKSFQDQGKEIMAAKEDLKQVRLPTGKCLNVAGDVLKSGTNVNMLNCSDSVKQLWRFDGSGRLVGSGTKCLNVVGSVTTQGANVDIQDCNNTPNQQWAVDGGRMKNGGGKCLAAEGDVNVSGGNVRIMDGNDSKNQKWNF